MFTGIIELKGTVISRESTGTNTTFWIKSAFSNELKVDESLSHDGVCLTIEEINDGAHRVTAVQETLSKTNLSNWTIDSIVNLERPLLLNDRLHGHFVQGHVDTTAKCIDRNDRRGSVEFTFKFDKKFKTLVIEKGSVCVNGISLTAFNVTKNKFTLAIIPYTLSHTNMENIQRGSIVNVEFDMLGKYIVRTIKLKNKTTT